MAELLQSHSGERNLVVLELMCVIDGDPVKHFREFGKSLSFEIERKKKLPFFG